jgi:hypothetical protein
LPEQIRLDLVPMQMLNAYPFTVLVAQVVRLINPEFLQACGTI